MLIEAQAPGKLILIGEYVVLEGGPALVAAIDRYAKVTLQENNQEIFRLTAPSIDINQVPFKVSDNNLVLFDDTVAGDLRKRLNFFKSTFEYAWQYCKSCERPMPYFDIRIETDAFYSKSLQTKLGFGSSAALTVALVKALFKMVGFSLTDPKVQNKLFRLSLAAHRKAQNNIGSGIDIAASAFSGVLQYNMLINKKAEQISPQLVDEWNALPMLTIFSGKSESTRKMVSGVNKLKEEKPQVYNELMSSLKVTAEKGCNAYKEKQSGDFLASINKYYNLLNNLGIKSGMPIISENHLEIADIVFQNGGVYKPSGAGSGDIGVAFTESDEKMAIIRQAVEKNNFSCVDLKIAH